MTATEDRPAALIVSAYGLAKPGPDEIRRSFDRIYTDLAAAVWHQLCDTAGVPEHRLDDDECERLLKAMEHHEDGAIRLCAQSFLIRARSFEHLSQADHIVRSAP